MHIRALEPDGAELFRDDERGAAPAAFCGTDASLAFPQRTPQKGCEATQRATETGS